MKRILQTVILTSIAILCLTPFLKGQNVVVVHVTNFSFTPSIINITTTDTVRVVWDLGTHSIVSDDGTSFNYPVTSANPTTKIFNLAAGSYPFHCGVHGAALMSGTITVTGPAGVNDPKESKFEFSAAPNPFDDQLSMNINIGEKNVTDIKIYDIIGKEVASVNLSGKTGLHSYKVDTSNLKPGIYFCTVYSATGILETKKLFRRN